jgi:hypothetical protein
MENQTFIIRGSEAIRIAERDGVTLSKYADPVEGFRPRITVAEARDIVREDAGLVYCVVRPVGWTAGDGTGHEGKAVLDYFGGALEGHALSGARYLGPDAHGIEPVWADCCSANAAVPQAFPNGRWT